jgi:hypothetical protein
MEADERRDIGLAAVEAVINDATPQEAALLDAVTSRLLPTPPGDKKDIDVNEPVSAQ